MPLFFCFTLCDVRAEAFFSSLLGVTIQAMRY
jgi:hypothetical protein